MPKSTKRPARGPMELGAVLLVAATVGSAMLGASCSEEGSDAAEGGGGAGQGASTSSGGAAAAGAGAALPQGGSGAGNTGASAGTGGQAGHGGDGAAAGGAGTGGGAVGGSAVGGSSSAGNGAGAGGASAGGSGQGGSGGATNGPPDACGFPSDGVWFEIDYSSAYTSTNPDWTFSPTAGFGEPQWAPSGESWPEVWDLYNNIEVTNDPIGTVAEIGWSGTLQIMLGLATLTSYDHATVCVEGRSVSTSSSVIFDVYNPLNGCGTSASMSHDWTVHAVGVDLATCMIPGEDFQALRVEPTGGSSALGLVRLRLTLHDAAY